MGMNNPTLAGQALRNQLPQPANVPLVGQPTAIRDDRPVIQALDALSAAGINYAVRSKAEENQLQRSKNELAYSKFTNAFDLEVQDKIRELDAQQFPTIDERKAATQAAIEEISGGYANYFTDPTWQGQFLQHSEARKTAAVSHAQELETKLYIQDFAKSYQDATEDSRSAVFVDPSQYDAQAAKLDALLNSVESQKIIPIEAINNVRNAGYGELAESAMTGFYNTLTSNPGQDTVANLRAAATLIQANDTKALPFLKGLSHDTAEKFAMKLEADANTIERKQTEAALKSLKKDLIAQSDQSFETGADMINLEQLEQYERLGGDPEVIERAWFTRNNAGRVRASLDAVKGMSEAEAFAWVDTHLDPRNVAGLRGENYEYNKKMYESVRSQAARYFANVKRDPVAALGEEGARAYYNREGTPPNQRNLLPKQVIASAAEQVRNSAIGPTGAVDHGALMQVLSSIQGLSFADSKDIMRQAGIGQSDINKATNLSLLTTDENRDYLLKANRHKGIGLNTEEKTKLTELIKTDPRFEAYRTMIAQDMTQVDSPGIQQEMYKLIINAAQMEMEAGASASEAASSAIRKIITQQPQKVGSGFILESEPAAEDLRLQLQQVRQNKGSYYAASPSHRLPPPNVPPTRITNSSSTNIAAVKPIVQHAAAQIGVPAALLMGVLQRESGFAHLDANGKPRRSKAGAEGIAQFMPGTAKYMKQRYGKQLGLGDNPSANMRDSIYMSAMYLKENMQKFGGDPTLAMIAYNWGPGNVAKYQKTGKLPEETRTYVKLVTGYYKSWTEKGLDDPAVTPLSEAAKRIKNFDGQTKLSPVPNQRGAYRLEYRDVRDGKTGWYPVLNSRLEPLILTPGGGEAAAGAIKTSELRSQTTTPTPSTPTRASEQTSFSRYYRRLQE